MKKGDVRMAKRFTETRDDLSATCNQNKEAAKTDMLSW